MVVLTLAPASQLAEVSMTPDIYVTDPCSIVSRQAVVLDVERPLK